MVDKKIEKYFRDILDRYGRANYVFVRYTNHPERNAGINPSYDYDTPLGVYAYQLNEITIDKILSNDSDFSFGKSCSGMNIFYFPKDAAGRKVILDKTGDDPKYNEEVLANDKKLIKSYLLGIMDPKMFTDDLQFSLDYNIEYFEKRAKYATKNFNKIFNITREAPFFTKGKRKNSHFWTELLRKVLNISLIIDNGSGTIHSNEPYQSVIFETSKIKIIYSGDNLLSNKKKEEKNFNPMPLITKLMKNQNLFKFLEVNNWNEIILLNELSLICDTLLIDYRELGGKKIFVKIFFQPLASFFETEQGVFLDRKKLISYFHEFMNIIFKFFHIVKIIKYNIGQKYKIDLDCVFFINTFSYLRLDKFLNEINRELFNLILVLKLSKEEKDSLYLTLTQMYNKIGPILDRLGDDIKKPPQNIKIKLHTDE